MDDLKLFLNSLTVPERLAFARSVGTTFEYLRQIAYGNRECREKMASLIERESRGQVTRRALRPQDWAVIWPELAMAAA